MYYPQRNKKVAIIVESFFFRKRFFTYYQKNYSNINPEEFAKSIYTHSLRHIYKEKGEEFYWIYYDCRPFGDKAHYPILVETRLYGSDETETFRFQTDLKQLIDLPYFTLRYGYLDSNNAHWDIVKKKKNDVLKGRIQIEDLKDKDFIYTAKQKVVDIKIGIDIASLSIKRLAKKLVLIPGDGVAIPVLNLLEQEGVQVILEPMGNSNYTRNGENIDFLSTTLQNFKKQYK